LEALLRDHTTKQNIFWATNNYSELGEKYGFSSPILPELITGINGNIIMPRVQKDKEMQQSRLLKPAIFTTKNELQHSAKTYWKKAIRKTQ